MALVVPGSIERRTGGYLYARRLVGHLRARGDRVRVVSVPAAGGVARLAANLSHRLLATLADPEVDVVVEDGLAHPSLVLAGRRLGRRGGPPRVALVHLLRADERRPPGVGAWERWLERAYLAGVDGCVTVNPWIAERVAAARGRPLPTLVAPPGGDHAGEPLPEAAIERRAHRPGPLEVVFAGAVVPAKGLHLAAEALARLPPDAARLTALGRLDAAPAYVRRLRRRIRAAGLDDRVELAGEVAAERVRARMEGAHLLALPSRPESCAIAALEAMACGLVPVLHADSDTARRLTGGEATIAIREGDTGRLAETLAGLAADRDLLARRGLAARRRYLEHPPWSETLDRLRDFLAERAAAAPAGRRPPGPP